MKVSLITTVKNEEISIQNFLDSVVAQTKKPNEFIIVDGDSKDQTYEILKKYSKKYSWIKVYQLSGANIAKGRNFAIKKTKSKIIAVTDAGNKLDKNWLKYITLPLIKNKADFVVGNYKPLSKNNFEYFQGILIVKAGSKLMPSRASSRSIAFKKEVWKKIKGYPEKFLTGEDTQFNIKAFSKFRIIYEKKAIVYWKMRPNLCGFSKQFFLYGKGDKKQENLLRMKFNLLMVIGFWFYLALILGFLFINSLFSLILILMVIFYFLLYSLKISLKTKNIKAFLYVPFLDFIKKTAYIMGATFGR